MSRCCLCRAASDLEPTDLPGSGYRCADHWWCSERVKATVQAPHQPRGGVPVSDRPELPPGFVYAALCTECGERPNACGCPEGFHGPIGIEPHPRRVHCCRCDAVTHEFVRWKVGDSYSFGPLCLECRLSLDTAWCVTGLDDPVAVKLMHGEDRP